VTNRKVVSLEALKIACKNCSLSTLCLPLGLDPQDVEQLNNIIKRGRPYHRGDHVFVEKSAFSSLRVITSGSVKTYTPDENGEEQVLGFHLPGELIGLDAIQDGKHNCSAIALETTGVCEIPFDRLEHLSSIIPSLQHQIYRLLSREIGHETEMLTLLGKKSAEARLATFLISLSSRMQHRGFSPRDFFISMSRHEIGNYLGLAVETISRLFTRFQDEELLLVERKHLQLLDIPRLQEMAQGNSGEADSHQRQN
jgi:CRP/FNR family transcriptional regulator